MGGKMPSQYFRDWHQRNPHKAAEYRAIFEDRNPGRFRELRERWNEANPDARRTGRNSYKRGGKNHAELVAAWESQGKACAICCAPLNFPDRHSHIDHCHETGKFRGILCRRCNQQLGHFEQWPEFSLYALDYLERAYAS